MRQAPESLRPLLDIAADPATTPMAFWEALRRADPARLKRNGYHVLQAIHQGENAGDLAIKFYLVHVVSESDAPVGAGMMVAGWGKYGHLTDDQALHALTFLLEHKLARTYPGMIYEACYMGFAKCAKLLMDRGIYQPLSWQGYAGTTDSQRLAMLKMLTDLVDPSAEDLAIIGERYEHGSKAAAFIAQRIAEKRGRPDAAPPGP